MVPTFEKLSEEFPVRRLVHSREESKLPLALASG